MSPIARARIEYEPRLVEAAVDAALRAQPPERSRDLLREHRLATEPFYSETDERKREEGFGRAAFELFEKLGCARAVERALAARPEVAGAVGRVLVLFASMPREEDVDLEPAETREARALRLRVRPSRFAAPGELEAWLGREMAALEDLLDPTFGYVHEARLAERPSEEALVRDRYRVLFGLAVAGRLVRSGADVSSELMRLEAELHALYRGAPSRVRKRIEHRLLQGPRPDHRTLLACARETRALLELAGVPPEDVRATGPLPGFPCPLCRFPTHAWRAGGIALAVAQAIRVDFPGWTEEAGLCERCADIYELRSGAFAPGSVP